MLTLKQIKSLKPGDQIVINATFTRTDADGDIRFNAPSENGSLYGFFISPDCVSLPSEHGTSVPTPKYDPFRFLRKGDKVKIKREINGRILNHVFCNFSYDKIYTVHEDEKQRDSRSGLVTITNGKQTCMLSFYELELVTPVEELEPYTVDECGFAPTLYVRKNGKVCMAVPYKEGSSLYQTREEALAAAESLRDNLNAEWRKEQQK